MACRPHGTNCRSTLAYVRHAIQARRARTTLEVTAPLRLPHPIAIANVALRLYEPSTLLDTHALRYL